MENALQKIEPVDLQRIAEIRAALANSTYQIDPDRIAKHLLDLEKYLF